jgi:transcriptional regulator of acetoin/glycerol metabolism
MHLVNQYEKELILAALRRNRWNRLQTARELGIHKTTLFRKIRKLDIVLPEKDGRSKE